MSRGSSGTSEQGEIREAHVQTPHPPPTRVDEDLQIGSSNRENTPNIQSPSTASQWQRRPLDPDLSSNPGLPNVDHESVESTGLDKPAIPWLSSTTKGSSQIREEHDPDQRRGRRSKDEESDITRGREPNSKTGDHFQGPRSRRKQIPRVIEIDGEDDPVQNPERLAHSSFEYKTREPGRHLQLPHQLAGPGLSASVDLDLEEWLEMTGYHDHPYRRDALQRHRQIVALEIKRAELARDAQIAQEQRTCYSRAHSVLGLDDLDLGIPRSFAAARTVRSASVFAMPPPPVPYREAHNTSRGPEWVQPAFAVPTTANSSHAQRGVNVSESASDLGRSISPESRRREDGALKRRFVQESGTDDFGHSEKFVCLEPRDSSSIQRGQTADHPLPKASSNDVRKTEYLPGRRVLTGTIDTSEDGYDDGYDGIDCVRPRLGLKGRRKSSPLLRRSVERQESGSYSHKTEGGQSYPKAHAPSSREPSPSSRSNEPLKKDRSLSHGYNTLDGHKYDYTARRRSDDGFRAGNHDRSGHENHRPPHALRDRGRGNDYSHRGSARFADRQTRRGRRDTTLDHSKGSEY